MADIKQAIYETIDELVSRKFDEARLDKTGLAIIVSRKTEDEFIVDYLGQEMPAKAANPDAKYEKGDTVRVLLPNGELVEKPLILGVAIEKPKPPKRAGVQRWKRRSIDFLDPVDKTRITYGAPVGEVSSIYPRSETSFYAALAMGGEPSFSPEYRRVKDRLPSPHSVDHRGALELGEGYPFYRQLEFEAFAKKWEWLRFSVEFQTKIHKPPVRGRYWIRIELKYENETRTKREDRFFFRSFDLDFTSFFGDPYAFETWTKQEIVFKIPKGAVAIQTVWLLSDDAWDPDQKMEVGAAGTADEGKIVWKTLDANQAPIVQARNPSLFFVEPVDIEATPYFLEAEAWTSHKHKGYAHFFLKGERLVDRQSLAFLWFLEDPSYGPSEAHKDVMTGRFASRRYFEYGGYGWRPVHTLLNKKVEDNANYRMGWIAEEDLLKVYQYYSTPQFKTAVGEDEFPPGIELPEWRRYREHKYKVVAIYRPKEGQEIVLSEEIWLNPTLVPGRPGNFGEALSNKHGSFLAFFGYRQYWSSTYPTETVFTKEWSGEDGEIPPTPDWSDPPGSYWILAEDGSWQLDLKTAPDKNFRGFYHAAPKTATKPIVVKQALLGTVEEPADKDPNGWPGGNREKQPVRYWTHHFFPDDANPEGIVRIEGPRSHVYNSDGTLLKHQLTEQIFTLVPRFINSRDQLPPIIDQGWYYADGKPVPNVKVEEIGTRRFGDSPTFSMMREVWVGSDGSLRYKVLDKYNEGRVGLLSNGVDQNTLIFKVVLLSKTIEIPHTIAFSKAGQNGVNGDGLALFIGPQTMSRYEDPMFPDEARTEGSAISSTIRPLVFYGSYSASNTWVNDPDYKLRLTYEVDHPGRSISGINVEWDLRYPPNSDYDARLEKTAFLQFANGAGNSDAKYRARAILPDKGQSDRPEKLMAFYGKTQDVLWRTFEGPDGANLHRASGAMFVTLTGSFTEGGVPQALSAIYPVDVVVFNTKPTKFDPRLLRTNIPKEITYAAHGNNPEGPRGPIWVSYGAERTSAKSKVGWGLTRTGPDGLLRINYDNLATFNFKRPWGMCWVRFALEDGTLGWFGRPIIYRIRQYENPAINGWDGVSLSLDEKGGTIFAPTIGAGWKNPETGTFSGAIMGLDKAFLRPTQNLGVFGNYYDSRGQRPEYLTGLFGYQDGVSSFGLLESGLAFFGRADAGGRIWLDGRSGVISGGKAPRTGTQYHQDDLANSMRITLVDLSRMETLEGSTENGTGQSIGEYHTPLQNYSFGFYSTDNFRRFFSPAKEQYDTSAGFSAGVGFSTPAIEIGSYREFLYRGKAYIQTNPDTGQPYRGHDMIKKITPKEAREWQTQIENLEIPHYRKFLVTYDGTLYAMNAFIKGNIISSNIIGSQIFNLSGTFGVTDRGHMYIGGRGRKFTETYVENKGSWSKNPPTVSEPKTIEEILRTGYSLGLTSVSSNESAATTYEEAQTPFFVANDGRVFCQEIHISGESSINIGGFHVIPKGSSGRNAGDVYSYGTMYLIGPKYDPRTGTQYTTSVSRIALEAWGDLYLRGTLVNLGDVYLGSQTEKTYYSATSTFNSPFSIKAKDGGDQVSDSPSLPVRMSMWPLYFHAEENALTSTGNHAWVTLSTPVYKNWSTQNQRSHYMPAFSRRADRSLIGNQMHQSSWVLWRLDQLGMWTDGIIFGNIDWAGGYSSYAPIEDNKPMSYEQHAHLFQGWKIEYGPGGASKWMFGIQNISGRAPSTLLEAPDSIRLEAGRYLHTKGEPSSQVGVYMFASTKERERAAGLLVAGRGSYTEKSHVYSFADTFAFVSRAGGSVDDMSKVAAIFSISTASLSSYDYADDLGNKLGKRFNQGDQYAGLIWARGTNIALDATKTIGDGPGGVANYSSLTSSIRLNRTPDGDSNAGLPSGVTANGLAYIGGLNIVLNGIQVGGNEASLYVRQISAENQHGIYARFG